MCLRSEVFSLITCLTGKTKLPLAVALFLMSSATVALAQFDSGQISGFVRESSQAAVANAIVIAVNTGSGQQHKTTTNNDGYYAFPNLVVGAYTIMAEAPGFRRYVENNVRL